MQQRLDNVMLYLIKQGKGEDFISLLESLNHSSDVKNEIEKFPRPYKELLLAKFSIQALSDDKGINVIDDALKAGLWLSDAVVWCVADSNRESIENLHNKIDTFYDKSFDLSDRQTKEIDKQKELAILNKLILSVQKSSGGKKHKGTLLPLKNTINQLCDSLGEETLSNAFRKPETDDGEDDCDVRRARETISHETQKIDKGNKPLYLITITEDDFNDKGIPEDKDKNIPERAAKTLSYFNRKDGTKTVKFHTIQSYISQYKNNQKK